MRTYNEMTGELRKDTRKWQNMKRKLPQRFGILNHVLLSIKEAPFFISHCLYRTTAQMFLPLISLQSSPPWGRFLSYGWTWECDQEAQRGIEETTLSFQWWKERVGSREPETQFWVFLSDLGQVTELMCSVNEYLSVHYVLEKHCPREI